MTPIYAVTAPKWRHLPASTMLWQHLPASTMLWRHLPASTMLWRHLPASTMLWQHLHFYLLLQPIATSILNCI